MGKPTFPTFPSKTWWFFYMRNKTLARLEGWSAIFDPAGSYRSRRNNQSMRERCCQLLALANGQLFSHINARQKWLGWKDDPLSRETLTQRGLRTLLYLSFHFPLAWSHITFNFSFVFFSLRLSSWLVCIWRLVLLPKRYSGTEPDRRPQSMPGNGWRPPNNQISHWRQIRIWTDKKQWNSHNTWYLAWVRAR